MRSSRSTPSSTRRRGCRARTGGGEGSGKGSMNGSGLLRAENEGRCYSIVGPLHLLQAQAARSKSPLGQLEELLHQEGENGGRQGALKDQACVLEANAGQDRLAVAACADEGAERRGADVDDGR